MRHIPRAIVAIVILAMMPACGNGLPPSSTVVGDWGGRVAPAHFAWLYLRLRQEGSRITGVACYLDPEEPVVNNGIRGLDFSGAPVVVDYPHISVVSPLANTVFAFSGEFQSDGTIKGTYAYGEGSTQKNPMTLSRGGNYCGL